MATLDAHLKTVVDDYLRWLRARVQLEALPGTGNGWHSLRTPFLDRNNDFLEIYIKIDSGQVVMSDDGNTLNELEMAGCSINTPKRKEIFHQALRTFGLEEEEDGALVARCDTTQFPVRKHLFLQGLVAIADMLYLASPTVTSVFKEDVERWLDEIHARFTPTVKLTGRSGFDHVFDFVIPKSSVSPERLLKVFTKPNRTQAEAMVFSWVDTREARKPETQAFAVMNDIGEPVPTAVIGALRAYEVIPVPWGKRDDYKNKLAA